ncbi:hypothetical protein DL93DRAFT_499862 [Clavulina sp. PMI_390]|nr:hypothetical protein DL93DRAFT_499862 [Clavulina sp. PMI_390]
MSPNTVLAISSDVVVKILCEAHYMDIVRCRAVCKLWESTISSSVALQYVVWLGIHGKEDGDDSFQPRTSAERLQLLLDHEQAWATLRPRIRSLHPILRFSPSYLCGPDLLLIRSMRLPDQTSEGVLRHLPSTIAASDDTLDEIVGEGLILSLCIVDTENDLIVYTGIRGGVSTDFKIHIRSWHAPSINHPLALTPSLDLRSFVQMPEDALNRWKGPVYSPLLKVTGPYVVLQYSLSSYPHPFTDSWGVQTHHSASIILVLSWITGQVVAVSTRLTSFFSKFDYTMSFFRDMCFRGEEANTTKSKNFPLFRQQR